jgi:hypothetical protein
MGNLGTIATEEENYYTMMWVDYRHFHNCFHT